MEPIRDPLEAAARIQKVLHEAGVESMVIGGLAVAIWGEPRTTRDADIKVSLQRKDAETLIHSLPADRYQLAPDSASLLRQFGFLFIKDKDGPRIDLLLAETSFDDEAIARRRDVRILGDLTLRVCTPEDLIIYKMISTRARDQADLSGILARQRHRLDHAYVERWLAEFEQALDDSTLVRSYRRMLELVRDDDTSP